MGKGFRSGTIASGQSAEALVFSYCNIDRVTLTIWQGAKVRSRIFTRDELPAGLKDRSNPSMYHHISVYEDSFTIGTGSGSWATDFQNRYGLFFYPCVGLSMSGAIGLGAYLSKRKKSAC
jgi:hypothetical protein